jgi:glyoxylase I family protein
MTVHGIDHINFRASGTAFAALRAFYCDVLGLEVGARPPLQSAGLWLYAGPAPIVHLVELPDAEPAAARDSVSSAFDHVAFRCSNLHQVLQRLRRLEAEHAVIEATASAQVQVRLRDPSGLTIELVFALSELSAGIPEPRPPLSEEQ